MLSINISELIWTVINFFLLYFLLKRFLYRPILRVIDARRERLDAALGEEKAARDEADGNAALAESEKALRLEESERIVREGHAADAERSRAALAGKQAEEERLLTDRAGEIRAGGEAEREALRAETGQLASALAKSLLSSPIPAGPDE